MKYQKPISILVICIAVLACIAASAGIFSSGGQGAYEFTSVHGQKVEIYGRGIYHHMATSMVPDGIAQDVVTMGMGIPLLLIALYFSRKGSLRGRFLLSGTLLYFWFTYIVYLMMVMYNEFFLVYVGLTSMSFFALVLVLLSFDVPRLGSCFGSKLPVKFIGGFLIFIAVAVGGMWLSRVIPTLTDGIIPTEVLHNTTLVVQGLDLAFLLPLCFVAGVLLIKKNPFGFLLAPLMTHFLMIMMTAIAAKVVGQMLLGVEGVLPVLIGFSLFAIMAALCSIVLAKNVTRKVEA